MVATMSFKRMMGDRLRCSPVHMTGGSFKGIGLAPCLHLGLCATEGSSALRAEQGPFSLISQALEWISPCHSLVGLGPMSLPHVLI